LIALLRAVLVGVGIWAGVRLLQRIQAVLAGAPPGGGEDRDGRFRRRGDVRVVEAEWREITTPEAATAETEADEPPPEEK
jgi:hypothetical protein